MFSYKKILLPTLVVITMMVMTTTAINAETFPKSLERCFDTRVATLLTLEGSNRNAVKRHFLRSIDSDLLGRRAFGGRNWLNFSQKEKEVALDLYFDLLFTKGSSLTKGMRDARNTVIKKRLADHPAVKRSSGNYHVVVKITLDNGRSVTAAVLLTPQCKVFDLGQGGFASRFVTADDVDRAMRNR